MCRVFGASVEGEPLFFLLPGACNAGVYRDMKYLTAGGERRIAAAILFKSG